MQFDVIVVGAGVEGSATAYQLIKNGAKRVLLLEQVISYYSKNHELWYTCIKRQDSACTCQLSTI